MSFLTDGLFQKEVVFPQSDILFCNHYFLYIQGDPFPAYFTVSTGLPEVFA